MTGKLFLNILLIFIFLLCILVFLKWKMILSRNNKSFYCEHLNSISYIYIQLFLIKENYYTYSGLHLNAYVQNFVPYLGLVQVPKYDTLLAPSGRFETCRCKLAFRPWCTNVKDKYLSKNEKYIAHHKTTFTHTRKWKEVCWIKVCEAQHTKMSQKSIIFLHLDQTFQIQALKSNPP